MAAPVYNFVGAKSATTENTDMKAEQRNGRKKRTFFRVFRGVPWRPVRSVVIGVVAVLSFLAPQGLVAHDIPNDVTVQTFVKPDGSRLRLLVRVPLGAMRDMDYPKPRGTTRADLMDVSRAESTLRDAATLWIGDFLDVYENDEPLGKPQVPAERASLHAARSF